MAREINSIWRDVTTAAHERCYQDLGSFLLHTIWKYLACEVSVMDMRPMGESSFRNYTAPQTSNGSMICSISHHVHMMWGKPTSATSISNWGDFGANVREFAAEISHPSVPRRQRLLAAPTQQDAQNPSVLKPSTRCGLEVKADLKLLRDGAATGPNSRG